MADYTNIANVSVEPLAPVTSELMTSLRDNPAAIAEGALGAPRIKKKVEVIQKSSAISHTLILPLSDNYIGGALEILSTESFTDIFVYLSKDGGVSYGFSANIMSPVVFNSSIKLHFDTLSGQFLSYSDTSSTSGSLHNFGIGVNRVKVSVTLNNTAALIAAMEYTGGLV